MNLTSIIQPEDVILALSAQNKTDLLHRLSSHAAVRTGLEEGVIKSALIERERLGSTGIGHGVALPHAPVGGLVRPFAALAILKKPIDFAAVDDLHVDVVFLLLSPEDTGEYLKILAVAARRMSDEFNLSILRQSKDVAAVYSVLIEDDP